ncbi:hypothetical protein BU24DRAFT_459910 [Aaosphaeria arxii CBS 175.79]|uniref:Retrotransposon gag domain-containing protein n=1 Tax=Aaosphaeria arxii CBS 175.79 TaxID=1450172 RepID=A0A6A5Y491_9PLEO|nr:uncharacterized protein BU24DRAFT_459910 [Aaosphaeria arxii CBS 175.79]KAF2020318.1 hypothetical protein BU24DRAFT_459910 [Aaosphaeria arxii CBS 175.79]
MAGYNDRQKVLLFPDFCEPTYGRLVQLMKPYKEAKWDEFKEELVRQYAYSDSATRTGTRAFLAKFVNESHQKSLDFSLYYATFSTYSEAAVKNKQISEEEVGYYFFQGLCSQDQERMMFLMPEKDRPVGDQINTFKFQELFAFTQKMHVQKIGLQQFSPEAQKVDELRATQLFKTINSPQGISPAKELIRALQEEEVKRQKPTKLPKGVDPEVDKLVQDLAE